MLSAEGPPAMPHVLVLRFMVHQEGIPFGWNFHITFQCVNCADHVCVLCDATHLIVSGLEDAQRFNKQPFLYTDYWKLDSLFCHPLIWFSSVKTRGWRFLQTETQCGCVSAKCTLMCPYVTCVPPSPLSLTPPSVCSLQSALVPALPPPLPGQTPRHTPQTAGTQSGEILIGTRRERKQREEELAVPLQHFPFFPIVSIFSPIYHHLNVVIRKEKIIRYSWKYVKTHRETKIGHKQRPSEHDQRARHTQPDR